MTFEKITLDSTSTIKKAIKVMNMYKSQIICVINNKKKIIGTVTDGDVRRSIIKSNNLNQPIKKIMNKNPIYVSKSMSFENIQRLMKVNSVLQIPEIDNSGKLVKVHYWNSKTGYRSKKNIFFILAGGKGKRLWPLTKYLPKPMLKICKRQIL